MELTEAMRILNIESLNAEETNKNIKDNYRKLMKQYHPDVYTGDKGETAKRITEAYTLLREIANKYSEVNTRMRSSVKVETIILDLNQLKKLYADKVQRGRVAGKEIEISISKLSKMDSFILCKAKILHNGIQKEFTEFNRFDIYGNYKMTCWIDVSTLTDEEEVRLDILDKTRTLHIKAQSLKLIIAIDSNIKVEVIINKRKI